MFYTDEEISKLRKGVTKRLTIDGETKTYQAYYVPIEGLYFNDRNGRISTYIEQNDRDESQEKKIGQLFAEGKIDEYNQAIAGYIKDSANDGEASFKKTKEDIRDKGQKEPGVILRNGRIIDGNRRFTCLRELCKEGNPKFAFFECVILDVPETKEQMRSIKLLELNIQFNVDEKKDYNRIDFLVSFYKDTMDPNSKDLIDKKTYCYASGITESEFNNNVSIVETMLDYLEWRGMPLSFYVLKKDKLDGPIEDIAKKKKKWTKNEWDRSKNTIYSYVTFNNTGDRTRDIRKIMDSANKGGALFENVREKIENPEMMQKINASLMNLDVKASTPAESQEQKTAFEDIRKTMVDAYSKGEFRQTVNNTENAPVTILKDALHDIYGINLLQIDGLPSDKKAELKDLVEKLENILDKIKGNCQ